MKRKIFTAVKILLAAILVTALVVVGKQSSDYKRGQENYDEAEQIANLPSREKDTDSYQKVMQRATGEKDPYGELLLEQIDLAALRGVNPDVAGWIEIPGTELSYPVMQGEDNEYYLNHTWKKESNSVGSVFLECQVDPGLGDFNTIIYGHRMRDNSMFGSLKYYENISYWEENPSVYVVIDKEAYRYDIYAAYKADLEDITYGLKIGSRPKKQELIQFGLEKSVIDTGIEPTTFDRILTLSTCTGSGHASRWVVQAFCPVEEGAVPDHAGGSFEGTDDVPDDSSDSESDSLDFRR